MKCFIATLLLLAFVLPMTGLFMPTSVLAALHMQQESHNSSAKGGHHTSQVYHAEVGPFGEHKPHSDVLSYFENMNIDLKTSKVRIAAPDLQDVPFILLSETVPVSAKLDMKRSQGPPILQSRTQQASSIPVYLATQRLRI